jgi:hypothetical protein
MQQHHGEIAMKQAQHTNGDRNQQAPFQQFEGPNQDQAARMGRFRSHTRIHSG